MWHFRFKFLFFLVLLPVFIMGQSMYGDRVYVDSLSAKIPEGVDTLRMVSNTDFLKSARFQSLIMLDTVLTDTSNYFLMYDPSARRVIKCDTSMFRSFVGNAYQQYLDTSSWDATRHWVLQRGFLTCNQTITLSGDVSGSGTTGIVTTVGDDSHAHSISTLPTMISSLENVSNDGGNIDLIPGGIVSISQDDNANTITISATETDGSITNEGTLSVLAGGANDSQIHSNTSGSANITITGGANVAVSESGSIITIASTTFGNVNNAGSPQNDQVAIWTGANTIEGDPDLTFNGDILSVNDVNADTVRIGTYSNFGSLNINGNTWHDGNIAFGGTDFSQRVNIIGNIQFLADNNGIVASSTAGTGKDISVQAGASSDGSKGGDLLLYGGGSGGGTSPIGGNVYISGGNSDATGAVYLGKLQNSLPTGNIFISGLNAGASSDTSILSLTGVNKLVYLNPHDILGNHSHSSYQSNADTASKDATRYWVGNQNYLKTEVDGSISNEGALSVLTGGANDSQLQSNTSGSANVTIAGGTNVTVTESSNTITIAAASTADNLGNHSATQNLNMNNYDIKGVDSLYASNIYAVSGSSESALQAVSNSSRTTAVFDRTTTGSGSILEVMQMGVYNSTGNGSAGTGGQLSFYTEDASGYFDRMGSIQMSLTNASNGSERSKMEFLTQTTGSDPNAVEMMLDADSLSVNGGLRVIGSTLRLPGIPNAAKSNVLFYDAATKLVSYGQETAEVDGSISNEGSLSVVAGGSNDSQLQSNTSGSTNVTIAGGTNVTVSESGNTITIAAAGDGAGTVTSVTQGNGMTFSVNPITTTGTITLGTPSSVTGISTNSVSSTSHTHAVTVGTSPMSNGSTDLVSEDGVYDWVTSLGYLTTEVDGSITNEGSLTVGAGIATTSLINSNTSSSTAVTLQAGSNVALSEAGNTITIASSDAYAGTVTSVAAGSGMSFSTITSSGSVTMGTPSSVTGTSTNSSTTGTHTHAITVGTSPMVNGSTDLVNEDGVYDWVTSLGYLTAEVDGSITNEGSLTVGAGLSTTSLLNSNTSGSTAVTLQAGSNVTLSEAGNTITIASSDAYSGTVTSVSAGNGMNFTTITGSGPVTLGTPSSVSGTSTNSATSGTHSHAVTVGTSPMTNGSTDLVSEDGVYDWVTSLGYLTAEVDGSTSNEIQSLLWDATNHEVDISLGGTSAVIPLADDNGATEGLASFAASDFTLDANANVVIDYANGQPATSLQDGFLQAGDWSTFNSKLGAEVDGSVSNEGSLTVTAGGANDSQIQSNTSGSTPVTISGSSNVSVTESGNTITIAATGVGSGTVTSISQGNGMSFSTNPITTTGTITLGTPSSVTGTSTNSASSGTHTHAVTIGVSPMVNGSTDLVNEDGVYDWVTSLGYLTSEVDGSITNEGSLTVGAGLSTTSLINSNTSGSTSVTLQAGSGVSLSETGNTITISSPDSYTGTVTSVAAGNGMNFTTITGAGTVTMGTPSSVTGTSTNSATTSTHTHSITVGASPMTNGSTDLVNEDGVYDWVTSLGYLTAEVDGSITNEGSLTVGAGTSTTSLISSNTSGSTAVTLQAGSNVTLSESGNTITIAAASGGGGNVNNTGTPLNNQVPIWTNSTTIEGDPDLTFDGDILTVNDLNADTVRIGTYSNFGSFNINGNSWLDGNAAFGGSDFTERINVLGNIRFLADNNGILASSTAGIGKDIMIQSGASSNGSKGGDLLLYGGGSGGGTAPIGGDVYISGGISDGNGSVHLGKYQGTSPASGNVYIHGLLSGSAGDTSLVAFNSTIQKLVFLSPHDITAYHTHTEITPRLKITGDLQVTDTAYIKVTTTEKFTATALENIKTTDSVLIVTGNGVVGWIQFSDLETSFGNASSTIPSGAIMIWSTTTAPTGWMICDGAAISRTTYSALFAVIGTTYGAGNGSTTFNLPNLKGRVPVGYNIGVDSEFDAMGETGGSKTHTLSTSEIPAHNHSVDIMRSSTSGTSTTYVTPSLDATSTLQSNSTGNSGSGGSHNNLQPYITLTYIIKY
jgi:microcystin-dependent protein